MTFQEKLETFRALVESDTAKWHKEQGFTQPGVFESGIKTSVVPGKKYTKVDVGRSGRFMVVNETGEIFGIKAYGVIHKGHPYGTLDTTDQYFWGAYKPILTHALEVVGIMGGNTIEEIIAHLGNSQEILLANYYNQDLLLEVRESLDIWAKIHAPDCTTNIKINPGILVTRDDLTNMLQQIVCGASNG